MKTNTVEEVKLMLSKNYSILTIAQALRIDKQDVINIGFGKEPRNAEPKEKIQKAKKIKPKN